MMVVILNMPVGFALILSVHAEPVSSGASVFQHFSNLTPLTEIPDIFLPDNASVGHNTQMTPSSSSAISKFLIPTEVSTPSGQKGEPPHTHLLTFATAVKILNEKERKNEKKQK